MELPGVAALQSPNLSAWTQKLEVAQSARLEQQLSQAAGSVNKAGAATMSPKELAHLKDVCKDFESIFLGYMLKTMKDGGPKSDFLGKSQAEGIFTDMRDEELAKGMAKAGGIGLGRLMEEQLLRTLGKSGPGPEKTIENS